MFSSNCWRHNNKNVKCKCCWLVWFEAITSQQGKFGTYKRERFFSLWNWKLIQELYWYCVFITNRFLFKVLLNHSRAFRTHLLFVLYFMYNLCLRWKHFFPPKHCIFSLLLPSAVKVLSACQSQLCLCYQVFSLSLHFITFFYLCKTHSMYNFSLKKLFHKVFFFHKLHNVAVCQLGNTAFCL